MPVALIRAGRRPLMRPRADHLRRFRFDQGLEHQLHAAADHIDIAAGADRVEQLEQVKLTEGHRPSPS